MKEKIRVLGIDDSKFEKSAKEAYIIGVLYRINGNVENIEIRKIKIDGNDFVEKALSFKSLKDANLIMLYGLCFAGLNYSYPEKLVERTKKPVIVISEKKGGKLLKLLKKKGINTNEIRKNPQKEFNGIYYQNFGIEEREAKRIIKELQIVSKIPEPLRLADIIGRELWKR